MCWTYCDHYERPRVWIVPGNMYLRSYVFLSRTLVKLHSNKGYTFVSTIYLTTSYLQCTMVMARLVHHLILYDVWILFIIPMSDLKHGVMEKRRNIYMEDLSFCEGLGLRKPHGVVTPMGALLSLVVRLLPLCHPNSPDDPRYKPNTISVDHPWLIFPLQSFVHSSLPAPTTLESLKLEMELCLCSFLISTSNLHTTDSYHRANWERIISTPFCD
jgi:hypothetical protein